MPERKIRMDTQEILMQFKNGEMSLEEAEAYRKRRTRYLVLWIVMMVLGVLLGIVLGFTLVGEMLSTGYYWD